MIPCHRVVRNGGALGGYGGGPDRKRWLLELEGARPSARYARAPLTGLAAISSLICRASSGPASSCRKWPACGVL